MSRVIINDIEAKVAAETGALRNSTDWADFKRRCGIITGLEAAIGIINERRKTPEGETDAQ